MKRLASLLCTGLLIAVTLFSMPTAVAASRPELKVKTLSGASFDLAAQRGKWVIVNYWATWCHPCIHEMPALSEYVNSHANVTAIGLAYEGADAATLKAFLAKHPVSYPVARADPADPPAGFAAPLGLPTTYLIAPDGHLAHRFIGPITPTDLDKFIDKGE
jgi:thiol-disulfide isomerase/thioredoxin